jgi:hypothetical protein
LLWWMQMVSKSFRCNFDATKIPNPHSYVSCTSALISSLILVWQETSTLFFTTKKHGALYSFLKNSISGNRKGCLIRGHPYLTSWHRSFTFNSNKSPTWCNSFSVYYPDVCLQLNMFRAFSPPSPVAQWLQWQPLVLRSYCGDSRAVFVVGPDGPITTQYEGKTRGCHCSHWAFDDGQENGRNMFSCKQTSW